MAWLVLERNRVRWFVLLLSPPSFLPLALFLVLITVELEMCSKGDESVPLYQFPAITEQAPTSSSTESDLSSPDLGVNFEIDLVPTDKEGRGSPESVSKGSRNTPTLPVSPASNSHNPSPRGRDDKGHYASPAMSGTHSPPHKRRSSTLSPKRSASSGVDKTSPRSPKTINNNKPKYAFPGNIHLVKEADHISRSVTSSDPSIHKRYE